MISFVLPDMMFRRTDYTGQFAFLKCEDLISGADPEFSQEGHQPSGVEDVGMGGGRQNSDFAFPKKTLLSMIALLRGY